MSVVEHCLAWVWLWVWFPSMINKGKWYNDSRRGTKKSKKLNAQKLETAGTRYSNINESGLNQKQGKKGGASHSYWQEMEQNESLLPTVTLSLPPLLQGHQWRNYLSAVLLDESSLGPKWPPTFIPQSPAILSPFITKLIRLHPKVAEPCNPRWLIC